jgi:uncharacterized protein
MRLIVLEDEFGIARLKADAPVPKWATRGAITSVTRTDAELSIVCMAHAIPEGIKTEKSWKCLKIVGPLDFSLTGVLQSIAGPLAAAGLSIFAISTYDTDYILVHAQALDAAIETLRAAGHQIES